MITTLLHAPRPPHCNRDKDILKTAYTRNTLAYPTVASNTLLADVISLDANLDYRVDVMYAGTVMTNSASPPTFIGKMYRLTTSPASGNNPHAFSNWGLASGPSQVPTVLLATFSCTPTPCTGTTDG